MRKPWTCCIRTSTCESTLEAQILNRSSPRLRMSWSAVVTLVSGWSACVLPMRIGMGSMSTVPRSRKRSILARVWNGRLFEQSAFR